MLRRILDIFSRIENHMDMVDGLNETVIKVFKGIRKHYGY